MSRRNLLRKLTFIMYFTLPLQSLYQVNYVYMQPIVILSILSGIWGVVMTMTMLDEVLKEHNIRAKFLVLQLVLLLAKLQGLLARLAVWNDWFPCKMPITPTVYTNCEYLPNK